MDLIGRIQFVLRLLSVVVAWSQIIDTTRAQAFEVYNFQTCQVRCLDQDYWYFSNPQGTAGVCCSQGEANAGNLLCKQGGTSTVGREEMPFFACPSSSGCGTRNLYARLYSQTYTLNPSKLDSNANFCNHQISFATDAGINDVLKIEFVSAHPSTTIHFAVGETFEKAESSTLISAQGQTI